MEIRTAKRDKIKLRKIICKKSFLIILEISILIIELKGLSGKMLLVSIIEKMMHILGQVRLRKGLERD